MSSENKPIQLGLCCLNTTLRQRKPTVFSSRTMIVRSILEKGVDTLKKKIEQNLQDMYTMILWNEKNGIKVMRMSSQLFPHITNPKIPKYTIDFVKPILKAIGNLAKKLNHRLTFHPGQYNVVGTPNPKTFQKTIDDLQYHASVMDAMNLPADSVMVVHGGGVYNDKEATIKRWCSQYSQLPETVRKRLVLENCEHNFNIEDCLRISEIVNIPVVFDTHHYECYCKLHPDEKFKPPAFYMKPILDSWKRRNIKPKFHVSEQGSGRCGHHSDYIETIPDYLLEIPEKWGVEIDIMIEAKKKELAIFKLYEKYPQLNCIKKS